MPTSNEQWEVIQGYDTYMVSDLGNIKNRKTGRILRQGYNGIGYKTVELGKGNKFYVHRLAAQVFIPNPDNLPVVNHKDKDRGNNVCSNLEWATYSDNVHYSIGKRVLCVDTGLEYESVELASKSIGHKNRDGVYRCCIGKQKTAGGYSWRYAT